MCSQDISSLEWTLGCFYSVTSAILLPVGGFMDAQKTCISGMSHSAHLDTWKNAHLLGKHSRAKEEGGGGREGERQRMWLFRNRKGLKKNHDNQKNVLLCLSFSVCTRLHKSHSQLCGREWWSLIPFRRQKQRLVNNEALGSSYSRKLGTLWVTLLSSECVLHLFQKHWVSCSIIYNQNNSS